MPKAKKPHRPVKGPSPRPTKWAAAKAKEAPHPKPLRQREIEEKTNRRLTQRQKRFAELYVEGTYSIRGAIVGAGYTEASATGLGSILLDPKRSPHVCEYIAELQEERERKYGVTLGGQLKRLYELSRGAEQSGQFSAAINAEKLRSVLGGLTVDRRETINSIDQLTKDQILNRLSDLQKKYPQAFQTLEGSYEPVIELKTLDHVPDAH
jgi:hypothetical protein